MEYECESCGWIGAEDDCVSGNGRDIPLVYTCPSCHKQTMREYTSPIYVAMQKYGGRPW